MDDKALNPVKNGEDLLLASTVFAHDDDLKSIAESMTKLIKPDVNIVIEVQYSLNTSQELAIDNRKHDQKNNRLTIKS